MTAAASSKGLAVRDPWPTSATFTLNDHPSLLAWSPDGDLLAAGSHAGDVIVTDPVAGSLATKMDHPGGALAASWAPHGLAIAAATTDGTVHVIRPQP
jgi:WD40 repeat protein